MLRRVDGVPYILMVEDNLGDVVLMREYLGESGFACHIHHCATLQDALQALAGTAGAAVDGILLDLSLPDSTGLPTLAAVIKCAPTAPIVVLTGTADEALASQALKAGAQDYLPKGDINGAQLVRTIRYAIERKRTEAALSQAKDAAEAANQAKDRFLAALSHELRTPLTPVLAQVQLLERDASLSEELHEAMVMIRRNIELEARLIDDLLDLTRVTHGKLELRRSIVDVHRLIQHSMQFCQAEAAAKGVRLEFQRLAERSSVDADPDRIQQVLWNLLANAVKFTPAGGVITITSANAAEGWVEIRITDSGLGIAPELLPRIFEAFEQGSREVTRQFGGLGLGLAISRSIVAMHAGVITAASPGLGRGATFVVALQTATAPTRSATAPSAAPATAQQLRILLCEDHENTAKVITLVLKRSGHRVVHARSVAEAFTLAVCERPDLLISDIGLPDGSGLELMRRLREHGLTLKAIVISGYGSAEDIQESQEAGFFQHLTKPFNDRALLAAVGSVVAAAGPPAQASTPLALPGLPVASHAADRAPPGRS
jgi:two-component system CheB/CheR fusion protein